MSPGSPPSALTSAATDIEAVVDNHMQWLAGSPPDAEVPPRSFAIDIQEHSASAFPSLPLYIYAGHIYIYIYICINHLWLE